MISAVINGVSAYSTITGRFKFLTCGKAATTASAAGAAQTAPAATSSEQQQQHEQQQAAAVAATDPLLVLWRPRVDI